ncbi:MAG: hypothetical protein E7337_00945 [Clostridiales bacterium]|nr:hypothetical protein [Clostridiales bacterium]
MKRWLSAALSLTLLITTVLGDISWAIAEETEIEAVSAEIEAVSADIEAEVPLSTDAGDSGLVIDVGEIEIIDAPDGEFPEDAEIVVPDGEVQGDAEMVVPEDITGEIPSEEGSDEDTSEEAPDVRLTASEDAEFTFGYASALIQDAVVFEMANAESEAIATVAEGSVLLCTGREEGFMSVSFNTEKGVVSGWMQAEDLLPMNEEEIVLFMDAAAAYESVVLYNDNIDLPLSMPACVFAEETADAPEIIMPDVFGEGETEQVVEKKLTLTPAKVSLAVKENFTLKVTDESGNAVENAVFTTDNGEVASVTEAGLVTANGEGSCNINAAVNGEILACAVTVCAAPAEITVPQYFEMVAGQTQQLEVTFSPAGSASLLTFETSHASIASVDENGLITAVGPGTATITARTRSGSMDECIVTVNEKPEGIVLSDAKLEMSVKMKATLDAVIRDKDGEEMDVDFIYTYIPADPEKPIVSVDGDTGVITAKNVGNCVVYVTAKNGFGLITDDDGQPLQAECAVSVAAAPYKVKLNATKGSIGKGEYFSGLTAAAYDKSGNEVPATFTYKSGSTKYVTVDEEGEIYGKKTGSAYVYVYAHNGKYARCKVTVKKAPSKVSVKPESVVLSAGGMVSAPLKPSVNSGAACNSFTYSGYDRNIISVDANGVITSKNAGSTNITVSAYNDESVICPVSVLKPPVEVFFEDNGPIVIGVEQTSKVSARNLNADGDAVPADYTYSVAAGDENILSVNSKTGEIKGLSVGTATVYVSTHNGVTTGDVDGETVTAACTVKVLPAPEKIALAVTKGNVGYKEKYTNIMDHVRIVMPDGETMITLDEAREKELYAASFSFRSSKSSYVSVNASTGEITGKKAGKSAYIYVTSHNGASARIKITVKKAPTKVTISPSTVKLGANGMQYKLTAKVNSGAFSNGFTFTSSDETVVKVDKTTGLLTSVGEGTATITAKSYNGKKGTRKVTVFPEPAQIMLSDSGVLLGVGSSFALKTSAVDAEGATTYANYEFSVLQDKEVIKVDSTGKITAVGKGDAVVTVRAHNGITGCVSESGSWIEAQCAVRVVSAPEKLETSASGITIGYKERFYGIPGMVVMTPPAGETECMTGLTYKSSRTSYVTVDEKTGAVYGKKTGYSYISIIPDGELEPVKVKVTVKKAPTKASLSKTKLTLAEGGQTYQLKASVNSGAACSTYTWKSSDTNVVTVSANGLITTVGTGTATITVTPYKGTKATCTVTVVEAPTQVFMPESVTVAVGQSISVPAEVCGLEGAVSYADITFSTEDERIRIDESGRIVGVAATGSEPVVLKVRTHNGVTTHLDENGVAVETLCLVNVVDAPESIGFAKTAYTIGVGEKITLEPVLYTENGETVSGGSYTYTVEGTGVSVSADGTVTGKKTGTAYVRISTPDGTVSEPCKVVVKKAPTSVKLTPASGTLGVGQKDKFTVKLSSGSAGSYTFTSSNEKVAVVEPDGTITAVGVGKATITVKTYNGKKDTSKITVKEGPEFLDLNTSYIEVFDETTGRYELLYFLHLLPGESYKLTYKQEAYTVGKAVQFVSEDPAIASVTENGTVTAEAEGCTAIVVESSSGETEVCFVVVEDGGTPFEFIDDDGIIEIGLNEIIPMPEVTNGSELYDLFIEYTMDGSCAEIILDEDGRYWLKAVKPGTGTLCARSVTSKGAYLSVTVAKAPTAVSIDMPDVVLVGESVPVNVVFDSIGSYDLFIGDEEKAVITSDGLFKAIEVGEVEITATLKTGLSASKTVLLRNAPDNVMLSDNTIILNVGDEIQLEPIIDVNAYTEFDFVSHNPDIANVSETGLITAMAPGEARVMVNTAVPGVFARCDVKVLEKPVPQAFEITPEVLWLTVGGEGSTFTVELPEGDSIASVEADNSAIFASIAFEGNVITVEGPAAAGGTAVTVKTAGGLEAICSIRVTDVPASVSVTEAEITLAEGETGKVSLIFEPDTAWGAVTAQSADADIAYADADIAYADANGVITAVSAGETEISFAVEGMTEPATVKVSVLNAPEIIRLGVDSIDVVKGAEVALEKPQLLSTKGPSGGSYDLYVEDEDIAVIENGVLTALKEGSTTIKARAYNGVYTYIPVTVWPEPTEILFADESILLAENEACKPVVLSADGAVVNAEITSDSPEHVRVEADGSIVGVAVGSANITATYAGLTATVTALVLKPTEEVTLNETGLAMGVKERFTLKATLDEGAASAGLEMVSDDPTVASVSRDGVVTALRPGKARITVTAFGGASAVCEVTVLAAPTGVAIETNDIDANVLEAGVQLKWRFDADDQGGSVRFESDDESIASVDENGVVTFNKVGWTTIGIVTYNGRTDYINVTVHRVPEKIAFTRPVIVMQKGDIVENPVVMTRGSYASYEILPGTTGIVEIDDAGRFAAVEAGTTVVSLKTGCGLEATCTVTVVEKLAGMQISHESLSLAKGEKAQLSVSFADENAIANVRYVSSNSSIATVDAETGEVTAIKKGSCTIYVQTLDGSNSDSCKVTVNGPRYRMFMAYEYFSTEFKNNLYFSQNNVNSMKAAFSNSSIDGVKYDIHTMKNPSKNSLLSGMASYFADSNDSDVNVIYLCSHGHANINDSAVNGYSQYGISLQGYKTTYDLGSPYYYITATEIYACLSQIKGKVVLILDSCNSGQFILNMTPRLNAEEDHRISVLTAVQGGVNASYYDVTSTTKAVDFFTYFLLYGIGYDEKKDKHDHVLRADSNDNDKITLSEFFNYGKTATSGYVSRSSVYKASWFHGNRKQVPQSYIKGDMGSLVIYDPK